MTELYSLDPHGWSKVEGIPAKVVSKSDYVTYKLEHLTASMRPQSSSPFSKPTNGVTVSLELGLEPASRRE